MTSLPVERRSALAAELRRRLDAGDKPFSLTARAWIATGRRPPNPGSEARGVYDPEARGLP